MRTASLLPALNTLAALALACAALQPLTAAAQQPCTAIQSDAERLACYDRALRPAPAPAPAASAAAPAAAAPSSIATEDRESRRERRAREAAAAAASAPPAAPPPRAAQAAPAGPAAVDPIAPAPVPAPRVSAAAPDAPAAPVATRARSASTKEPAPAIVPVVIVEVRALPGRAATFTSDKGEVWVQTDNQHSQYPQAPFKASIEPGAMSSFFLVPEPRGRAIRVRRGD